MRRTLRDFIALGGISHSDAFSACAGPFASSLESSVSNPTLLNRNLPASPLVRLHRRLIYNHKLKIRLKRDDLSHVNWCTEGNKRDIQLISFDYRDASDFNKVKSVYFGNFDDAMTDKVLSQLPPTVGSVFAHNCDTDSTMVTWLPIGRDPAGEESYDIRPIADKEEVALANFSIGTHPIRRLVARISERQTFVVSETMDGYGRYSGYRYSPAAFLPATETLYVFLLPKRQRHRHSSSLGLAVPRRCTHHSLRSQVS